MAQIIANSKIIIFESKVILLKICLKWHHFVYSKVGYSFSNKNHCNLEEILKNFCFFSLNSYVVGFVNFMMFYSFITALCRTQFYANRVAFNPVQDVARFFQCDLCIIEMRIYLNGSPILNLSKKFFALGFDISAQLFNLYDAVADLIPPKNLPNAINTELKSSSQEVS